MQRFLLLLMVFLNGADLAAAQSVDKAKLRGVIEYPRTNIKFYRNFNSDERDESGNLHKDVEVIARLQLRLRGTVDDVSIYREMAKAYDRLKDEKKSQETCRKMEALLSPYRDTTDPKKVDLLLEYAILLEDREPVDSVETEKYVRKAVQLAPDYWKTWSFLAFTVRARFRRLILGDAYAKTPYRERADMVSQLLRQRLIAKEVLAEAETLLLEMRRYSDRSVQLAPAVPLCRKFRYKFLKEEAGLRNLLVAGGRVQITESGGGRMLLKKSPEFNAEILEELKVIAHLVPEEGDWQFEAASSFSVTVLERLLNQNRAEDTKTPNQNPPKPGAWKKIRQHIPPEDLKFIHACLDRLETLAAKATPEGAEFWRGSLLAFSFTTFDFERMEKYACRILQANPNNLEAEEFLQYSLCHLDRAKEAIARARERLRKSPTPRGYYLLAKSLLDDNQPNEAEKILRSSMQRHPDHLESLLLLAAVLLKTSDQPQSWTEAGQLLDRAQRCLQPSMSADRYQELDYLRAVQQALTGEVVLARLRLARLQADHPDNDSFRDALAAFGK